jgi:hypothetical protein
LGSAWRLFDPNPNAAGGQAGFPLGTCRVVSFFWKSWPVFCMVKVLARDNFLTYFCNQLGGKK